MSNKNPKKNIQNVFQLRMQDNGKTSFVKLKQNKKCVDLGQDNYPVRLYLQTCECDPYNWFEDQFGYFQVQLNNIKTNN